MPLTTITVCLWQRRIMRLVNIRVSLVAAVAFIAGIFAFYEALFAEIWFGLAAVVLLSVMLIVCAAKRFSTWKIFLIALIFLLLGFGRSWICYGVNTANEKLGEQVTISGRVTDLSRNGADFNSVYYLEECADSEGNTYDGRIKAKFTADFPVEVGNVVTLKGNIYSVYPIKSEIQTYYLRNKVRYEIVDVTALTVKEGSLKPDERVRRYVYDVTKEYMPNNGGLMFALLTGDRGAVDSTTQWAFSRAGIAHLLAVSGLHVGFVAAVLCFMLRRLHLRAWLECLIVTVPLLFYAYICGFSPSVMRAITMLICTYAARMLLSRYDMLSSISWAALITLVVCPFYLFDVGFQLSFMSVFGIATLYAPLNRYLTRKNIKKTVRYLLDSVAVSMCCILATLFVLVVSAAFVLSMIGLLPWVFHYLLLISDALLQITVRISEIVAQVSFATVSFRAMFLSIAVVAVLLFALGGYINLNKLGKKFFYPLCIALLVISIVFSYIPRKSKNGVFVVQSANDTVVAAISDSGNGALVGDFVDYQAVMDALSYLQKYRLNKLTLYFSHCSSADPAVVNELLHRFDIQNAFLLSTDANDAVTGLLNDNSVQVSRLYPNENTNEVISVRSVYNAALAAVTVHTGELDVCIVYGTLDAVADMGLGADIYLLPMPNDNFADGQTTLTPYQSELSHNYGANKYGNFTIIQKGDKISLKFR